MNPQEEGVTHPATPLGTIGRGVQRISEKVLLEADRSQKNDLCETQMRLGAVIPQTGTTRIKDISPAIRTEGKFHSLKQQSLTIKREIRVMQRQCHGV